MRRQIAAVLICSICHPVFAQVQCGVPEGQFKTYNSGSYYVSLDGKKIDCYGMVTAGEIDDLRIHYYDAQQKWQGVKLKEVRYLMMNFCNGTDGKGLYVNLSITKYGIHRILAYNEKYFATELQFSNFGSFLYIFDWEQNLVEPRICTGEVTKCYDSVSEAFKKYFPDCPELVEMVNKNRVTKERPFPVRNIPTQNCGTSIDIFEKLNIEEVKN